jgi:hypothetical protein
MASTLQGVSTTLAWTDFTTVSVPAPTPGGPKVPFARTQADISRNVAMEQVMVDGKPVFQVRDTIQVKVAIVSAPKGATGAGDYCWKADWLSTLPQATQDAQLDHEQGHFKISALLARDQFNEFKALVSPTPKQFPTKAEVVAAVDAIRNKFSKAVVKKVEDKYDDVTHHDPVQYSNEQATWNRYFSSASSGTPLLDVLASNNVKI